jgi:hypothetical protein
MNAMNDSRAEGNAVMKHAVVALVSVLCAPAVCAQANPDYSGGTATHRTTLSRVQQ